MNLYIEVENGVAKNHPASENNLIQAFGSIPAHWEPFTRVQRPILDVYEVVVSEIPAYEKVDGVWMDVWQKRNMTTEEKLATQQRVITLHNAQYQASNWSAWTLDETICEMVPPVPRPELSEGGFLYWCGADNNWKETPARPEGNCKFDYLAWQWIEITP